MKKDIIEVLRPYNTFYSKKRLGPNEDGGYVVPEYVLENCSALFTYGVGHDNRYEEEFSSKYDKPAYLFDHTIGYEPWEKNKIKFFSEGLGINKESCKEWYEHYEQFNIEGEILLKIDIEDKEYEYISETDISKMGEKVMGLLLEIHWIDNEKNRKDAVKILDKLNEHFVLCHIHGNNWGDLWEYEGYQIPKVLELTFINRKYTPKIKLDDQDYPIQGLDIPNNPNKEDYKLDFLKREQKAHAPINKSNSSTVEVVVTLTTLPTRLISSFEYSIKNCLESLVNQNFHNYEVHFNIPDKYNHTGEDYQIPEWLNEMASEYPNLKIFRGEDYGSITKIVDTIKRIEDPECIIITVDDDLVYHEEMVSEQYKNQKERFDNCAVGYDGIGALENVFRDIRNHYVVSVPCNVKVNMLQHYKTVSYKRKYFEEDFFTDFVGKSWADDVVVSAYMGKRNIPKYVTYYENEKIPATKQEWETFGGVTTFPIVRHTQHESEEGCNIKRKNSESDNFNYFVSLGYLK